MNSPSQDTPRWSIERCAMVGLSAVIVAVVGLAMFTSGCSGTAPKPTTLGDESQESQVVDTLSLAVGALREVANSTTDQSSKDTLYYLNQWIGRQQLEANWKPDPMVQQIPRAYQILPTLGNLDATEFSPLDLGYLQQNLWLHDIASRLAKNTEASSPAMEKWLAENEAKLGSETVSQLRHAELLFDWTVRNIQLDPLPAEPKATAATPGSTEGPMLPSRRGDVGPGYAHLPLQSLLYGRGDAWERARIFMLLCRQLSIDAVMLATDPAEGEGASIAWLPAVLIGKELYLFDSELGFPVPTTSGTGIATLTDLASDPQLLEALTVGDEKYRVQASQLKTVVAFIDAEPEALSRRMGLLESSLVGEQRLALSVSPTALEKRLRATSRIGSVSLWRVPFAAFLYQVGQQEKLSTDPAALTTFIRETQMFQGQHPLMQARNLHFQGKFDTVDQEKGARTIYLESRPPDAEIDLFSASDSVRQKAGINQILPQDKKMQGEVAANMTFIARRAKQHATYWMGITYFESGRYEAAAEWFRDRTLASGETPWESGATYNLARCYEILGKTSEAIELYKNDDSPQKIGNQLRATWLEKQGAAPSSTDAQPAETPPADATEKK